MTAYVTVSVKVSAEFRRRMRELGIQPSEVIRKALEEEVRRREVESLKARIEELKGVVDRLSVEDVVRGIREDRESR